MTHNQILETKKENEILLLNYFSKVGIPTQILKRTLGFNGRNNRVEFLTLECINETEFNRYKTAFHYADAKGGDYLTWEIIGGKYYLSISIKDGFN